MGIIDAHQHFWKYDPVRLSWITDDLSTIKRDFLPEDLAKVYKENGIGGCVAVQAEQSLAETDFLLDLAKSHSFIKGVVGWIDLRAKDLGQQLEAYEGQTRLKGFRHIVQDEKDPNFLLRPDFKKGIGLIGKKGYTYDILVYPHQLGAVLEFVREFDEQPLVIDHLAKPYIKDGFFDGWAALMTEIAKCEHVYCKLSGMVTEADWANWDPSQFIPYIDHVLHAFGPGRTLFGSDWPVSLLAADYGQVKRLVTDRIETLGPSEQLAIMGDNAKKFYNLS